MKQITNKKLFKENGQSKLWRHFNNTNFFLTDQWKKFNK